ncbi:hypothetical protein BTO25_02365, partial [Bacillus sp. MB366]
MTSPYLSLRYRNAVKSGKQCSRAFAFFFYSRLLKDRIIMLGSAIDDNVANSIVSQLLFLQAQDSEKDIYLYINSPGGSVTAGFAIYDTIQHIKPDVPTICIGMAA